MKTLLGSESEIDSMCVCVGTADIIFAQNKNFYATQPSNVKKKGNAKLHTHYDTMTLGLCRFDCNFESKRTYTYRSNALLLWLLCS